MAKNVLQKHWDGTRFVEIHPVTKASNVFGADGKSIAQKVDEHQAEKASLTKVGHVQLNSAVNSTSEILAATPKAVKQAYDRADAAFTSASNAKTELTTAITGVDPDVVIPPDPTFPDLATAIGQISTGKKWASGTFLGTSAYSSTFTNVTGGSQSRNTMEVNGLDFTPSVVFYQVAQGVNAGYNTGSVSTLGPKHSSGFHNFNDGSMLIRLTAPASLRLGGFTLPIQGALDHFWIAFE